MYTIFTQDSSDFTLEDIESNLIVYKDILDLKQLYHELKTWYVFKKTHFQEEQPSNLAEIRAPLANDLEENIESDFNLSKEDCSEETIQ